MSKKDQKLLFRIILSIIFLILNVFIHNNIIKLICYIIAYLLVGGTIVLKAIRNIFKGNVFDENFLMSLATIGAFFTGEYLEGVLVMLLYQIGELFQSYAVGNSRKSISDLMDIRPDYANVLKDNEITKMDPEDVNIGDIIIVKTGEKIPLDGILKEGNGFIDTRAITGESVPKNVKVGTDIYSGCINMNSLLTIEVTKKYSDSTVATILDLVENASANKAKTESFITKFARYYTPIVVILALLLAIIPPLIMKNLTFIDCLKRAMTFLVISCPCALVISVPLGFFGGIGGAAKKGILIKGSNYIETLSKLKTVVFDKTGTLTKGTFEVTEVKGKGDILELAAYVEAYSNHPIAESIRKAYQKEIKKEQISDVKEIVGHGIKANINGDIVAVGNKKLMQQLNIDFEEVSCSSTIIYVAKNNEYLGYILISDVIKDESLSAIKKLHKINKIKKIVILTGDNEKIAKDVSLKLNIDEYSANLLPADKVKEVECILEDYKNIPVAFVGDGVNDAPVLMRADVGIAMGALGSDAATQAADVVIMDDNISKISTAISLSKRTINIVKQNIYFAIGTKILFLLLGALGYANMMEAVFADVGVSILAILNSMRALKIKD